MGLPGPNAEQGQGIGPEGPEGAVGVRGEHDAAVGETADEGVLRGLQG